MLSLYLKDPNPDDPLNKEAAQLLQTNERQFDALVQKSIMYGAHIDGNYFPPCHV